MPGSVRPITSLQNERVKMIRSLEMRKIRRETGLFVAEGASVLVTARDAGWRPVILVFLAGSAGTGMHRELVTWAKKSGAECLEVAAPVLGKLAAKDNPQTMLAVFEQRWRELPRRSDVSPNSLWVVLENIRDPGNLGTIIRTTDAVGADGVVLVGNCADPYSRESVRATMGSVFDVPLAKCAHANFLAGVVAWHGEVIGTRLDATEDFRAASYRAPAMLLMGGEGPGLSRELAAVCTRMVKIPMAGRLDSLNLAVATALMLYELRKDRLRL
jgi:TrmH family RNA methyltransferase